MSIYEQAIEDIKKYKMCKQNCPTYILSSITGPTGPTHTLKSESKEIV